MPSQHAFLSASGSSRWLACPPSAMLESEIKDKNSPAAAEGTLAHSIGEILLNRFLAGDKSEDLPEDITKNDMYSPSMLEYVKQYVDYCIEKYNSIKASDMDIEVQLTFDKYVKKGFGTADCLIVSNNEVEIVDLKYGKGVAVDAKDNTQLQLYALGVIEELSWLYQFDKVTMTIVQPRKDSISSQTKTVKELVEWGERIVIPTAELAYRGEGTQRAGAWCTFCKVGVKCRAYKDYSTKAIQKEFKDLTVLSDDEVAELLAESDKAIKYLNKLKDYALDEALKGKEWPGFKLVEGRSTRKYSDTDAVAEALVAEGYSKAQIYKPEELNTLTAIEKLLGKKKFSTVLGGLVVKAPGKPTLVPDDDKRPKLDLGVTFDDLGA